MSVVAIGGNRGPAILVNGKGAPRKILTNAVEYFGHLDAWRGVMTWDEFSSQVMCTKRPPREEMRLQSSGEWKATPWLDDHTALAASWLAAKGVDLSLNTVGEAVLTVARWLQNRVNPVRDWLMSLPGTAGPGLCDEWLIRFAGAEDNAAVRAVSRMWLVSSVARVMQPGCQVDHVLILEGGQGMGKTQLLRNLCHSPAWFTSTPLQLGNKDALQQIQGIQIYLLDEFDKLISGHSASALKDFISQVDDRFRVPYGKMPERFLRQCVFAGATNEHGYLQDTTGNRRYWPVKCGVSGPIQPTELVAHRDALWGHAVALYRARSPWWPSAEERLVLTPQQAERETEDTWRDLVLKFMRFPGDKYEDTLHLTTGDIMSDALKLAPKDQTRWATIRVGKILRAEGYTDQNKVSLAGDRVRVWRKE